MIKLNEPRTATKTYWSVLNMFVNVAKIHLIPPFLVHNKLVFDFFAKKKKKKKISFYLNLCDTVFRSYPYCLKRSSNKIFLVVIFKKKRHFIYFLEVVC